ncbi:MAG: hypothetical protein M3Q29_10860 [Chloroflexota bacterium]|nr:hypothetical protein [Chloroflexota bacterium]
MADLRRERHDLGALVQAVERILQERVSRNVMPSLLAAMGMRVRSVVADCAAEDQHSY